MRRDENRLHKDPQWPIRPEHDRSGEAPRYVGTLCDAHRRQTRFYPPPPAPEGGTRRGLLALCAAIAAVVFFTAGAKHAAAQTQTVNIPDANLRAQLESALGKASGEAITRAEMATLGGTLDLRRAGIRDPMGIEYAVNVRQLLLERNEISDITPLADLTNLNVLALRYNLISDLTPLAGLRNLQTLRLSYNAISDLTPLAGARMPSLTTLEFNFNRISDLTPLAGFTSLRYLTAIENRITDLTPLKDLSLENLFLSNNRITDLKPLENMNTLAYLTLTGNHMLTDVSPLKDVTGLQRLSIDATGVNDIKPLADNTAAFTAANARIDLRDNPQLNANPNVATHVATLRARGVQVFVREPLTYSRKVRSARVTPEVEALKIEWDPLTVSNPEGYTVFWKSETQVTYVFDADRHKNVPGAATATYTIPGLTPGVEYAVKVRAYRSGDGGWTGGGSLIVYGVPLAAIGSVAGVTVTPGVKSLTVSWRPAEGAADYKVQWKSGDRGWDAEARQARAGGADKTEYVISGLEAGTEYTVRVIPARNEGKPDGDPSAEATGTPRAPEPEPEPEEPEKEEEESDALKGKVDATPCVESLIVSWPEVSGATGYLVQWRQSAEPDFAAGDSELVPAREGGSDEEAGAQSGADGSGCAAAPDATYDYVFIIPNLEPDVEYTVRVTPMLDERVLGEPGFHKGTPQRRAVVAILGARDGVAGAGSVRVAEGEDAELRVTLDAPTRAMVTVSWVAEDGTAKAGEDYRAMSSGRLTFRPGDDTASLRVPTLQDRLVEPDETFRVRLTAASNASTDPDAASATVTIVDDDTEPARARALDTVLAGVGRWVAADAVDAIGERFSGGREATEAQVSLGGRTFSLPGAGKPVPARSAAPAAGFGPDFGHDFDRERDRYGPPAERPVPTLSADSVSGSRFNLALGMDESGGATSGMRLWGRGMSGGFSSRPETGFRVDGDIVGGYVGVDVPVRRDALLGVALAHGRSDVDYRIDGATTGAVDLELTSVLPYGHWTPRDGLGVWGLLGAGWGNIGLRDEVGAVETHAAMRMAAAGARRDMAPWRDVDLDLAAKADGFIAQLQSDAAKGLPKAAGAAQRLRLSLEGAMRRVLSPVSRLTPSLEVGGRWDGGDAETGLGVEVGGGLSFEHDTLGLSVEARGRALLAHRESLREWGMSLSGRMDPGVTGRGPWVTLAPGWGAEGSLVSRMWDSKGVFRAPGAAAEAGAPAFLPGRLNMEMGWGVPALDGAGRLTPWAGLSMAGSQAQAYALGARMEVGHSMSLNLENRHSETGGYRLTIFGRLRL